MIINYKNKIYTDKLDYYRNIDFDAIKFDDNTSTDFDYFQFQYCNNFKFAHLVPTTHPVEKVFTGYLNVLFKDANNQDMFSTSQIQTMDARLRNVYHLGDLELYGLFIFSDPFDSQIIQIKN